VNRHRPAPRPRSAPHLFRTDWSVPPDHAGQHTCVCGSMFSASVHRALTIPDRPDYARLAAGDHDDD
jgi:hypothetical protein